jgi:hypothetical protein
MASPLLEYDEAIQVWPSVLRGGDRVHIVFRAVRIVGSMSLPRYLVRVLDQRRHVVATLMRGSARPAGGVVCVEWDGRDDAGTPVPPGRYGIQVELPRPALPLQHSLRVEG